MKTAIRYKRIDASGLLARGQEPCDTVRAAADSLQEGEGLELHSPFLPSPLIERMKALGYQARPERLSDGSWITHFFKD